MKLYKLTLIILEVNSLIDSGEYDNISIHDIHNAINSERLIKYLKERCKGRVDFSYLEESNIKYYEEKMLNIYNAYAGDELKKWGINKKGLCLVIAWTNEIIQQNGIFKS